MRMKKILVGITFIATSSLGLFFTGQPDGNLHAYFLDVGQGDAILFKTPSGKNILMDGGPDMRVLSELNDVLPFWGNSIDYILLSHSDQDHIAGLIEILKRYPVKNVMFAGSVNQNYFMKNFLQIISDKNISVIIADENSDIVLDDGVKIDVLFPFSADLGGKNALPNLSLVAKIIYGENEFLLMGDAETDEENILLNAGVNLKADILKVGHHGSKTSTGENFINKINPKNCIISVGKSNKFNHPHASTLKTLTKYCKKTMRTDLSGRIELIF